MIIRITSLLALLALAACAAPPMPRPPLADPGADTRAWFYAREVGNVSLVYGTPESDDVALSMTCREGSGRVKFSQGGLRAGEGIAIASGGRSAVLRGPTQPDELNGGVYMEAEADADHPVLQSFRGAGSLETGGGQVLTATGAERAWIDQFFAACASAAPRASTGLSGAPGWRFMYPLQMVSYSADAAGRTDLLIDCDAGSLRMFRFPPPRTTSDRTSLTLSSGSVRTVVGADFNEGFPTSPTGEVFRDPDNAQPELGASLPAASPVVREFLRTGRLSVANSGRALTADADAAELAEMRRYFARC
ncbi:MAG TPA: hypothetical protein VF699_01140 [Caulobacteraceae bacterium]|jgi:hypothetical protein